MKSLSIQFQSKGEKMILTRVCTECGAPEGTKHKRKIEIIWKKKPRDLIQKKKQTIIDSIMGPIN